MARFLRLLIASLVALLALTGTAQAAGGKYVFAGGTANEQAQVRSALNISTFNWDLVPAEITIHIAPDLASEATVGNIWLDSRLLDSGRFSWGVVQHEYAHQVDFYLLGGADQQLLSILGGKVWCVGDGNVGHADYGCERFASTLAWAYWPSRANSMRPTSAHDESAAMAPAAFRTLLKGLIGAPDTIGAKTLHV